MILDAIDPYVGTHVPAMLEPLPPRPASTATQYGPTPRGPAPASAPYFTTRRNRWGGVEIVLLPPDAEVPFAATLKRNHRLRNLSRFVREAA